MWMRLASRAHGSRSLTNHQETCRSTFSSVQHADRLTAPALSCSFFFRMLALVHSPPHAALLALLTRHRRALFPACTVWMRPTDHDGARNSSQPAFSPPGLRQDRDDTSRPGAAKPQCQHQHQHQHQHPWAMLGYARFGPVT